MAYQTRPNTGSLFKNERRTEETHANAQGNAVITCPYCHLNADFYLDAWTKRKNDGTGWQSLKFKPKAVTGPTGQKPALTQPRAPAREPGEDDDVPF